MLASHSYFLYTAARCLCSLQSRALSDTAVCVWMKSKVRFTFFIKRA